MLIRALKASPLLVLGICHLWLLERIVTRQAIRAAVAAGRLGIGRYSFTLFEKFYHVPFIDSLWKGIVILFIPSAMGLDAATSWQLSTSFADFGTIYAIVLIESARRSNLLTPMRMCVLCSI
jgi:hypothetical protein